MRLVRLRKILSWLISLGAPLVLMAFSSGGLGGIKAAEAIPEVDHSTGLSFVRDEEVLAVLEKNNPKWQEESLVTINSALLEESLGRLNGAAGAEVYFELNGKVHLRVSQRRPILRVFDNRHSYYLDQQANVMALSGNFSAKVPVVTGHLDTTEQRQLTELFRFLEADEQLGPLISGGAKTTEGEFLLIPSWGNHKILLGELDGYPEKLKKLKAYYRFGMSANDRDELKLVNLKYANQVVCTKR